MTLVSQTHRPDEVFAEGRRHREATDLVDLTAVVAATNAGNRRAVSFRSAPPPR